MLYNKARTISRALVLNEAPRLETLARNDLRNSERISTARDESANLAAESDRILLRVIRALALQLLCDCHVWEACHG